MRAELAHKPDRGRPPGGTIDANASLRCVRRTMLGASEQEAER